MKKALVEVTKEITFEAAHYLDHPGWTREKNLEVFKKCAGYRAEDPRASHLPHGHSYRLRVTVKGRVDPQTGFVMDFKTLKDILQREVFGRFDHRFINKEVEPFKGNPRLQTTVENILLVVWDLLEPAVRKEKAGLWELTLWETSSSFAVYRGEKR